MVSLEQCIAWSWLDFWRRALDLKGSKYEPYELCPSSDVFDAVYVRYRELIEREAAKQAEENVALVRLGLDGDALKARCLALGVVYEEPPGDDETLVAARVRHGCIRAECDQRDKEVRAANKLASRARKLERSARPRKPLPPHGSQWSTRRATRVAGRLASRSARRRPQQ
jgi:hypothetical protein